MKQLIILLLFVEFPLGIEYRFSENFGSVFQDSSGSVDCALNGNAVGTDSYDTISTDRGAYFGSDCNSMIQMPANLACGSTTAITYQPLIYIWALILDEQDAVIFLYNNGQTFALTRIFQVITFTSNIYSTGFTITPTGTTPINKWTLFTVKSITSGAQFYFSLEINGVIQTQSTLLATGPYAFNTNLQLGSTDGASCALVGFIWKLVTLDIADTPLTIGLGYASRKCVLGNCEASCDVGYIANPGTEYCLPSNTDLLTDVYSQTCSLSCTNGCYKGVCLDCACGTGCVLTDLTVACYCHHAPAVLNTCNCPTGTYFDNSECVACYPDCSACTQGLICLSCSDANSHIDAVQGCVCNVGYFNSNVNPPISCAKCRYGCASCSSYSSCVCTGGFFSTAEGLCVDYCTIGQNTNSMSCTQTDLLMIDFTFSRLTNVYSYGQHDFYMGSSDNFWPNYDSLDPWIIPSRGAYFTSSVITYGTYSVPKPFYLGNLHSFDMFFYTLGTGVIFSLFTGLTTHMQLFVAQYTLGMIYSIKNAISSSSLVGTASITVNTWIRFTVSLAFNDPELILIGYINNVKVFKETSLNFQFNQATSPYFTIGKSFSQQSFKGYLYNFAFYNYAFIPSSSSICSCLNCPNLATCLIPCLENQYWNGGCTPCLPSCTNGCVGLTSCALHSDINCVTYVDILKPCQVCSSNYFLDVDTCRECVKYIQRSDVDGYFTEDFLWVVLKFSVNIQVIPCEEIFSVDAIAKLGSGFTCELDSSGIEVRLRLGKDYLIGEEDIELNGGKLKASVAQCGYPQRLLFVSLRYTGEFPSPVAVIEAPISVFYSYQDLVIDGSYSYGKVNSQMQYMWTVWKNSIISTELSTGLVNDSSLLIKENSLDLGSLKIHLVVINRFNKLDSTDMLINVVKQDSLIINFERTENLICRLSELCYFRISSIESTQNDQFNIIWSFTQLPINTTVSQIQDFWASQTSTKVVQILGNYFDPQILYFTVYVEGVNSQLTGKRSLNITILPNSPSIVFSPSPGSVSVLSDLIVDAIKSIDISAIDQNLFTWDCVYKDTKCIFNYTKHKTSLTVSKNELQLYKFDLFYLNIRMKINVDKKLGYYVIEEATDAFQGKYVDWSVPNVTLKEYITGLQIKTISASKVFTINATILSEDSGYSSINWAINDTRDPFGSPIDREILLIDPSVLNPGQGYRLTFSIVTGNGLLNEFYYDFTVNTAPIGGDLSIYPTSGSEVSTIFRFMAKNWIDLGGNYPLTYNFAYKSRDVLTFFAVNTYQPYFLASLAYLEPITEIVVSATDSVGDSGTATSTVNLVYDSSLRPAYICEHSNETLSMQFPLNLPQAIILITNLALNRDLNFRFSSNHKLNQQEVNDCVSILQEFSSFYVEITDPSENLALQIILMLMNMMQNPLAVNNRNFNTTIQVVTDLIDHLSNSINIYSLQDYFNLLNSSIPINSHTIYNNTIGVGLMIDYLEVVIKGTLIRLIPYILYSVTSNYVTTDIVLINKRSLDNYIGVSSDNSSASVVFPKNFSSYISGDYIVLEITHIENPTISLNSTPTMLGINLYKNNELLSIDLKDSYITMIIPVHNLSKHSNSSCYYFDRVYDQWSTKGCWLVSITNEGVICRCNHLSWFTGGEDFIPENNFDEATDLSGFSNLNSNTAVGIYFSVGLLGLYSILGGIAYLIDLKNLKVPSVAVNALDVPIPVPSLEEIESKPKRVNSSTSLVEHFEEEKIQNELEEQGNLIMSEAIKESEEKFFKDGIPAEVLSPDISINNLYDQNEMKTIDSIEVRKSFIKKSFDFIIENHQLIGTFFKTDEEFSRFFKVTIVFFGLIGGLFFLGFFYQDSTSSSSISFSEVINQYGWDDLLILVYTTLIIKGIEIILKAIFKNRKLTDKATQAEILKLEKTNKIRNKAGIITFLALIAFFCWEISLIAANLSIGVSYKWVFNALVKFIKDIVFMPIITSFLKNYVLKKTIELIKFCISRIKNRKTAQIKVE